MRVERLAVDRDDDDDDDGGGIHLSRELVSAHKTDAGCCSRKTSLADVSEQRVAVDVVITG